MTLPLQVFSTSTKVIWEVLGRCNEQGTQWEPKKKAWSYSSKEQSRKMSKTERPLRTILQSDNGRNKCKDLAGWSKLAAFAVRGLARTQCLWRLWKLQWVLKHPAHQAKETQSRS